MTEFSIKASEGISVDTIKQQGSKAQQIAVQMFDEDQSGDLKGREVTLFNNCIFTCSEENTLTIKNTKGTENKDDDWETTIKYNTTEDLSNYHFRYSEYSKMTELDYDSANNGKKSFLIGIDFGKIITDLVQGIVNIDNAYLQRKQVGVCVENMDVNISNSRVDGITVRDGSLNLNNIDSYSKNYNEITKVEIYNGALSVRNSHIDLNAH